jgi:hypothetical protein
MSRRLAPAFNLNLDRSSSGTLRVIRNSAERPLSADHEARAKLGADRFLLGSDQPYTSERVDAEPGLHEAP